MIKFKYCTSYIILIVVLSQINMKLIADSNEKFKSIASKDELSIEEITELSEEWNHFVEYLFKNKKKTNGLFLTLPDIIWNRQIEKAYVSILSDEIKKNPTKTYNMIFLNAWNRGCILNFLSTNEGLNFLLKLEPDLQTFVYSKKPNGFSFSFTETRNRVFKNFMFWKELEIISQSNNIKMAKMSSNVQQWLTKKDDVFNEPQKLLGYKIKYTVKQSQDSLVKALLNNLLDMGGKPEFCSLDDGSTNSGFAIVKKEIFVIFIDDIPAYLLYPSIGKREIVLVRIISHNLDTKQSIVNISIANAVLIPMDTQIQSQWKKVFYSSEPPMRK